MSQHHEQQQERSQLKNQTKAFYQATRWFMYDDDRVSPSKFTNMQKKHPVVLKCHMKTATPRDLFDCCVYCHRICDRLLLLHLRLVATIIPLANARRQVVIVDVVDVVIIIVVRCCAVAVVVAIVVIVVIVVHRAIAITIVVRLTIAVAIFVDVVVCCADIIVDVIVRHAITLIVDAIVQS
jgi:hypothetical protein